MRKKKEKGEGRNYVIDKVNSSIPRRFQDHQQGEKSWMTIGLYLGIPQ